MRSVLLVGNKEERFLIRTLMKDLGDIYSPASFEEALQFFKANKASAMTVIVDERFELRFSTQSVAQAASDISRSQMTTSEFLEEIKKMGIIGVQTQYAVILADGRDSSHTLHYSEMGADMVLARPLGSAEIKTHFENFFKLVRNPPAAVRAVKRIRELVDHKKYQEAHELLEKNISLNPLDAHFQLLYAKTLINLGPDKFIDGVERLKLLDTSYRNSILVKKLLRETYLKKELFAEAHLCSTRIYEIESSIPHWLERINSAAVMFEKGIDKTLFSSMSLEMFKIGTVYRKRELVLLWEKWIDLVDSQFDLESFSSLVEALEKQFQPKNPDDLDFKKTLGIKLLKLYQTEKSQTQNSPESEKFLDKHMEFMSHLLDVDSQNGAVLLDYVYGGRKNEKYDKKIWNRLEIALGGPGAISNIAQTGTANKTGPARKGPLEAYIGAARICLDKGLLKEASDSIFVGKRIAPSDERLEALSLEWRKVYDSKQAA